MPTAAQISPITKDCDSNRRSYARESPNQNIGDSLPGVAIPKWRHSSIFLVAAERSRQFRAQFVPIAAHQNIGPHRNRNWALGVLAYGETRDAKIGGLFLNAARIRDHHRCAGLLSRKINIGERIEQEQLPGIQSEIGNSFARSWMGWENYCQITVHLE